MKKVILLLYLIVQLILYLLTVFIETTIPIELLTYSIIFTNTVFAILLTIYYKTKDSIISLVALFFTLIADTFLILIINQTLGMISFSFTQFFYFIKLKNLNNEINILTKKDIVRIICLFIILITVFIFTIQNFSLLIFITSFYFVMLLFNFIDSLKYIKQYPTLPIGFLLFILCDIFVGLNFLEGTLPLEKIIFINFLLNIDFNFIWFFYAPSQVLLVSSIIFTNNRRLCCNE